jgi:large subunit ribosomal protein L35
VGKFKTHSGAKKRFKVLKSGLVKKKKQGMRHLLVHKSSKRKRLLGKATFVKPANLLQVSRQLGI